MLEGMQDMIEVLGRALPRPFSKALSSPVVPTRVFATSRHLLPPWFIIGVFSL